MKILVENYVGQLLTLQTVSGSITNATNAQFGPWVLPPGISKLTLTNQSVTLYFSKSAGDCSSPSWSTNFSIDTGTNDLDTAIYGDVHKFRASSVGVTWTGSDISSQLAFDVGIALAVGIVGFRLMVAMLKRGGAVSSNYGE